MQVYSRSNQPNSLAERPVVNMVKKLPYTHWLLPEGVEEILPEQASKLEALRRRVLDDFSSRGFSLVIPPVMEFADSLLVGISEKLDTQTYKFMDQHSQRMLGVRADITPQIARIDAHYLAQNAINKLCYAGTVLRTQPDQMGGQRELLQVGAEIFGVADESADIEIIQAMLQSLSLSLSAQYAQCITLSLSHVGIYRQLLAAQQLDSQHEAQLRDVLLRKSAPDLHDLGTLFDTQAFVKLLRLQGDATVLNAARAELPDEPEIHASLMQLERVIAHLEQTRPEINLHIDLADVAGYRYHTGLKYAAYVTGRGRSVATGGRYDRVGEFARPATGFSADLKSLVKLAG